MGCCTSSPTKTAIVAKPVRQDDDEITLPTRASPAGGHASSSSRSPPPSVPSELPNNGHADSPIGITVANPKSAVAPASSNAPTGPRPLQNLGNAGSNLTKLRQLAGPHSSGADAMVIAAFESRLNKIEEDYPYLALGHSSDHPLAKWLNLCRESAKSGNISEAQAHLLRVTTGLKADDQQATEAFKRFDVDSSGGLDKSEFVNMCAYLGWGREEAERMKLNDSDVVSLDEFKIFLGNLGGIQRLFALRRQRAHHARTDVCDYSGLSVGDRVRSYFWVERRKSHTWREATVLEVDVQMVNAFGPASYGMRLEFGFGKGKFGKLWRARQVVPPSFVLSGVEDASVAAALREVGILDSHYAYWALLLPDSELRAIRRLEPCQCAALSLVRRQSIASHDNALKAVQERFKKLKYTPHDLQAVFGWVQDFAPICVHIGLDKIGPFLENDEFYRNQFETKTSCGALDDGNVIRKGWEHELFGGTYDDAKPFERCKYGALNVMNDYRGVVTARQYGDSYLVLKDVRLRCTFASEDSGGIEGDRLAVVDKYAHVLQEYDDSELAGIVNVAVAALENKSSDGMEIQLISGPSIDPVTGWITMGYPKLKQKTGRYYFEIKLFEGVGAPQVGVLSSKFKGTPYAASAKGVGDDEHGWALDGQNAARWHMGRTTPWREAWPSRFVEVKRMGGFGSYFGSGMPKKQERVLSQEVVVGVAVDLDTRRIWFTSDGTFKDTPDFTAEDIPKEFGIYPAASLKGRAAFNFGNGIPFEYVKHDRLNLAGQTFGKWPGAPAGSQRLDCPVIGNEELLNCYKEVQIHGEVNLKRNVQRLVAARKYHDEVKTERVWSLHVNGQGPCSSGHVGVYRRAGIHDEQTFYKSDAGAVIYWNAKASRWRMYERADFSKWRSEAPGQPDDPGMPPRDTWVTPDEERGVIEVSSMRKVLADFTDFPRLVAKSEAIIKALSGKYGEKTMCFRYLRDTSLEKQLEEIAKESPRSAATDEKAKETHFPTADDVWDAAVEHMQGMLLAKVYAGKCEVVETDDHPYENKTHRWNQEVEFDEAHDGMRVIFASKTCTFDKKSMLKIFTGGLRRKAAGPGARVEVVVQGKENAKVWGTVVERLPGDEWTVRLDRHRLVEDETDDGFDIPGETHTGEIKTRPPVMSRRMPSSDDPGRKESSPTTVPGADASGEVEDSPPVTWPDVGDAVEARYVSGAWYKAKIAEITIDGAYLVTWADGDKDDRRKTKRQLRKPTHAQTNKRDLEDLDRYCEAPNGIAESFVVCMDSPTSYRVSYGGEELSESSESEEEDEEAKDKSSGQNGRFAKRVTKEAKKAEREAARQKVGSEISEFGLKRASPLMPIFVKGFAGAGPAQEAGVKDGWFVDLVASITEGSKKSKEAWARILHGLGGLHGNASVVKLVDAVFHNLDETKERLNGALRRATGVEIVFTNSASPKPVLLKPEALAVYRNGEKVGDEIRNFRINDRDVHPEGFLKADGPAQKAGVRSDWVLDVGRTFQMNPRLKKDDEDVSSLKMLRPASHAPSMTKWATAGAPKLARTWGKFYYEVVVGKGWGAPQLGFATEAFELLEESGSGVGDDLHSWAVDGMRHKAWHGEATPLKWRKTWQEKDIIGLAIDMQAGVMRFSLNGEWFDEATMKFEVFSKDEKERSFYPAVSVAGNYEMNIPKNTWKHKPPMEDVGIEGYWAWSDSGNYTRPLPKEDTFAENRHVVDSLLRERDITVVFRQPNPQKVNKLECYGDVGSELWSPQVFQGDHLDFQFITDGDGADSPEKRWGIFCLVLPSTANPPKQEVVDMLAETWVEATSQAYGVGGTPVVEKDAWDEARLRALCRRHGWEFEWMTEDGERKRRAREAYEHADMPLLEAYQNSKDVVARRTRSFTSQSGASVAGDHHEFPDEYEKLAAQDQTPQHAPGSADEFLTAVAAIEGSLAADGSGAPPAPPVSTIRLD